MSVAGEHWSDPIIAESEETIFLVPARGDVRLESGIRWAMQERDYARVAAGLACPQCATPFPAPVGIMHTKTWRELDSTQWRWTAGLEHGLGLVAQGCCPICGFEVSPEMFALQDEGHADDHAQMQAEVDGFQGRADEWFTKEKWRKQGGRTERFFHDGDRKRKG